MNEFKKLITQYQHNIWIPKYNNGNIYEVLAKSKPYKRTKEQQLHYSKVNYKCFRVNLFLNATQRRNVLATMYCTTIMYNLVVDRLNEYRENNLALYDQYCDFRNMRTLCKPAKKTLREENGVDKNLLDGAIKHAVTAFKSGNTNKERGHIKEFMVKKQKQNRNNRVIEIDKNRFNCATVIDDTFVKEIKCQLEGRIDFHTGFIADSCLLRYCKQKNRFTLIINHKIDRKVKPPKTMTKELKNKLSCIDIDKNCNTNKKTKIIQQFEYTDESKTKIRLAPEVIDKPKYKFSSLDPGLSSFMTCLTDIDHKKYGEDTYERVKGLLRKKYQKLQLNNAGQNREFTPRRKRKFCRNIERKIHNIINNLHWQTANELTKTSQEVIIGNMSSKGLVQTNRFDNLSKQAILRMGFFKFRQRLKFKCLTRKRKYICVNEAYTTKICSVCSNVKHMSLSDRVYNCNHCGVSIQRDLNSCRGIWIKSMDKGNFRL